jgi:hypothetical protein
MGASWADDRCAIGVSADRRLSASDQPAKLDGFVAVARSALGAKFFLAL